MVYVTSSIFQKTSRKEILVRLELVRMWPICHTKPTTARALGMCRLDQFKPVHKPSTSNIAASVAQTDNQISEPPRRGRQLRRNPVPDINTPENNGLADFKYTPSKEICALYERAGISSRMSSLIYLAHAHEFNRDLALVTCSNSTMNRERYQYQQEGADEIFDQLNRETKYTLHWDGKTFSKRGRKDKRIAVVITNGEFAQPLDVVNVPDGSAQTCSLAIRDIIEEWQLEFCINKLSFDTENTNSGCLSGICLKLEEIFGKELLHLACRRHIYEILAKEGFNSTVEGGKKTKSPTIPIFVKFCQHFNSDTFVRIQYEGVEGDTFLDALFPVNEKIELIDFCKNQIEFIKHCRNDYMELLKLVIILLSPDDRQAYTVHAPGCVSRARFMGHMLYSIKIYLYRLQLNWSEREMDGIRRFILFILKAYLKHWFLASHAIAAPRNDLCMLKKLNDLLEIMPITAQAVIGKLTHHLWYLSESLVPIALFDASVPIDVKRRMVDNLDRDLPLQTNKNRFQLSPGVNIGDLQLDHFISLRSRTFFELSGISDDFLHSDPSEWETHVGYINGRRIVSEFTVVNDAAERVISLYQHIEPLATTDDRKTRLIQVVQQHR